MEEYGSLRWGSSSLFFQILSSGKNGISKIAPDFAPSSRRAKACILDVCKLWGNAENGSKDQQDGGFYFSRSLYNKVQALPASSSTAKRKRPSKRLINSRDFFPGGISPNFGFPGSTRKERLYKTDISHNVHSCAGSGSHGFFERVGEKLMTF